MPDRFLGMFWWLPVGYASPTSPMTTVFKLTQRICVTHTSVLMQFIGVVIRKPKVFGGLSVVLVSLILFADAHRLSQ